MSIAASMSGLTSAARAIDIIGNNIANAQTVGFKTSKAQFANVLAATTAGGPSDSGSSAGVSAAIINQRFSQGSLALSSNPLDMAIGGLGFFRLDNAGEISYTRDGQFRMAFDAGQPDMRVLVNRSGFGVTGYSAEYTTDPQGVIVTTAAPQRILIDPVMPALATSSVKLGATLDARVAPPAIAPFAAGNPLSYSHSTAIDVFDSTGAARDMRMYFSKTPVGNVWDLYTTLDSASQTGPISLAFDTSGRISTAMPLAPQTFALPGGASLSVALDLSGTVQYGNAFSVDGIRQDGYREGVQNSSSGFSVGADGVIQAFYSNGQSRKVAQVVLANFNNPNALFSIGDNQWIENTDPVKGSGKEVLATPGSGGLGFGSIQANATEQSNVDLSSELVALIEQQRNYQASAQTFKILDQVLQNLQNATR